MENLYNFEVTTIDGQQQTLDVYRDRVLLIVNVASQCGFTPQYAGLEQLYRKYHDQGFCVLGFPCDQFGHQEPGKEAEIKDFCKLTYDVTFPMFAKIEVNGPGAHPLYQYLKAARRGLLGTKAIKWNFTKFLMDRHGDVVRRYAPTATPEAIEQDVVGLQHCPQCVEATQRPRLGADNHPVPDRSIVCGIGAESWISLKNSCGLSRSDENDWLYASCPLRRGSTTEGPN